MYFEYPTIWQQIAELQNKIAYLHQQIAPNWEYKILTNCTAIDIQDHVNAGWQTEHYNVQHIMPATGSVTAGGDIRITPTTIITAIMRRQRTQSDILPTPPNPPSPAPTSSPSPKFGNRRTIPAPPISTENQSTLPVDPMAPTRTQAPQPSAFRYIRPGVGIDEQTLRDDIRSLALNQKRQRQEAQ